VAQATSTRAAVSIGSAQDEGSLTASLPAGTGAQTVTVTVRAEDGTSQTYDFTVTVENPAPLTDPTQPVTP
jgi:VCBS repeat-containing protein